MCSFFLNWMASCAPIFKRGKQIIKKGYAMWLASRSYYITVVQDEGYSKSLDFLYRVDQFEPWAWESEAVFDFAKMVQGINVFAKMVQGSKSYLFSSKYSPEAHIQATWTASTRQQQSWHSKPPFLGSKIRIPSGRGPGIEPEPERQPKLRLGSRHFRSFYVSQMTIKRH